jgi:alpha-N-arabinofuranosidase
MKTIIRLNREKAISAVDHRLYSSFLEHMGRAIYTGIYEPDHPGSDPEGFRGDVQEYIRDLNLSHIRYPGGNFLSGYCWEDGVGDRKARPVRRDLAWFALEPNLVGINEFVGYCRRNALDPMIGVNLGTRGPQDAANLVEYCNIEGGTHYSDLRRSHGYEQPHGIRLWCLGNEMDGPWQIGSKTADEYGRIAAETAKMMKWMDPSIELVACGSSYRDMPSFGSWERTVLSHCWEHVDYLSLHQYYQNLDGDIGTFLARGREMDRFIKEVSAICAEEKAKRDTEHEVKLSFDEWNVWYHFQKTGTEPEKWICPRPIEEETYNFADALLVGSMLITLINNCDMVKIACLAQLVNVIAPIMTKPGGDSWRQTTYFPFLHASLYGRGTALNVEQDGPTYSCRVGNDILMVDCAAVLSQDGHEMTLFLVNKNLETSLDCQVILENLDISASGEHIVLKAPLDAVNSVDNTPVQPRRSKEVALSSNQTLVDLEPASWNVIRIPLNAHLT